MSLRKTLDGTAKQSSQLNGIIVDLKREYMCIGNPVFYHINSRPKIISPRDNVKFCSLRDLSFRTHKESLSNMKLSLLTLALTQLIIAASVSLVMAFPGESFNSSVHLVVMIV